MLKDALTAFLDLLYPKSCHICSKILNKQAPAFDDHICAVCSSSMKKMSPLVLSNGNSAYQRLMACYAYEGPASELIHKFKYENRPYLAKTVVRLMSDRLTEHTDSLLESIDCLVPIPLHPTRAREREFNQSELIAKRLSDIVKKPHLCALKRRKDTQPQISLNREKRAANVRGAFALNNASVKRKNILLIDDVVTTAATVGEAARVLKKAGAKNIWVFAFAKG